MLEGPQEGRNDPSPNPYRRGSGKPTQSYTGQHTLILANKVQGSAGKKVTHRNKFPGPREPRSHVKNDKLEGLQEQVLVSPQRNTWPLLFVETPPILALALNIILVKTLLFFLGPLPTTKHQDWS